jgi:protein-S-isoprenylcysteine O-methyltransferase Ste14
MINTAADKRTHKGRNDLIGEHRKGDTGQVLFAILFGIVWIADSFFFGFTVFLNEIIPNAVRVPLGAVTWLLAGYFSFSGLKIVFGEVRDKPAIIRKGVFGIVRHPVYLGEILVYMSLLLFSLSLAAMAVWLMAIFFLHYIARYEEKLLIDYFGDEYRLYMAEVPMWLPGISKFLRKR